MGSGDENLKTETEEKHLTTGKRWRDMVCHVSHFSPRTRPPFEVCVRLTGIIACPYLGHRHLSKRLCVVRLRRQTLPSWVKNRSRHHQCQAEVHPWTTLPHSRYWIHAVPKRIVCTIRSETSTTTRHRTTAAVVTMVLPVKGIVKGIAVGSSTGAVDTHVVSAGS